MEGKNDYAFFGRAFSDKSFKPLEFGQEWSEREAAPCENAVSDTRRFFKGKPRQLFGSGGNRVMLIQSDGKQKAERHFEMVSKEIGMNSVADMRSLLVIDSDAAPEPERVRPVVAARDVKCLGAQDAAPGKACARRLGTGPLNHPLLRRADACAGVSKFFRYGS